MVKVAAAALRPRNAVKVTVPAVMLVDVGRLATFLMVVSPLAMA